MPPRARKAAPPAKKAAPKVRKTVGQLAAELNAANRELADLRASGGDVTDAVNAYKERVRKTASEAKQRYGWCSAIDEALEDLDIDISGTRFRFTAMLPVTIEATLRHSIAEQPSDEEKAKFFAASINRAAIEAALQELHQQYLDDEDALLSNDWDTSFAEDDGWDLQVGDNITVQDIELVKT